MWFEDLLIIVFHVFCIMAAINLWLIIGFTFVVAFHDFVEDECSYGQILMFSFTWTLFVGGVITRYITIKKKAKKKPKKVVQNGQ